MRGVSCLSRACIWGSAWLVVLMVNTYVLAEPLHSLAKCSCRVENGREASEIDNATLCLQKKPAGSPERCIITVDCLRGGIGPDCDEHSAAIATAIEAEAFVDRFMSLNAINAEFPGEGAGLSREEQQALDTLLNRAAEIFPREIESCRAAFYEGVPESQLVFVRYFELDLGKVGIACAISPGPEPWLTLALEPFEPYPSGPRYIYVVKRSSQ